MTHPNAAGRRASALTRLIQSAAGITVLGSAAAITIIATQPAETTPVTVAVPHTQLPSPTTPSAGPPAPAANALPALPGPGAAPAAAVPLSPSQTNPAGSNSQLTNRVPGAAIPAITPLAPGAASPLGTVPAPASQPPCQLGWPAPARQGGLASLIGLAPLAGPFSSEAFALGAVYQPILQLAGPVLAEIAPVITQHQPAIDPIIARVQAVEAIVLEAILPYYGPHRAQLIAAEGELAKLLVPILDRVYKSPAASCFVAWQGQLLQQAKGQPLTVASLARPGTVVRLGR